MATWEEISGQAPGGPSQLGLIDDLAAGNLSEPWPPIGWQEGGVDGPIDPFLPTAAETMPVLAPEPGPWPPPQWAQQAPPRDMGEGSAAPALDALPRAPWDDAEPAQPVAPAPGTVFDAQRASQAPTLDALPLPDDVSATAGPQYGLTSAERAASRRQPIDAEELAADTVEREIAREQYVNDLRGAELETLRQQERESLETQREIAANTQAQLQGVNDKLAELATQEIDPDRWWKTRSTGQTIAAFAAATLGGWNAGRMGKNMGMDAISRAIDRDVDAQRATLDSQRSALGQQATTIGQMMQSGLSQFQAESAFRAHSWDLIDKQLAVKQAQFDPRGTTWNRVQQARLQARQQRSATLNAMEQQAQENAFKERELRIKERASDLAAMKALRSGKGKAKPAPVGIDPVIVAAAGGDAKLASDINALAIRDPLSGRVLLNPQGQPVQASTIEEAKNIRAKAAAAAEVIRLVDSTLSNLDGWEPTSRFYASDRGKRLKSNAAQLLIAANKAASLGALDKGVQDVMGEMFGGDPTAWQSPREGLLAAREGTLYGLNSTLRSGTYYQQDYDVPLPRDAKPVTLQEGVERAFETGGEGSIEVDKRVEKLEQAYQDARAQAGGEGPAAVKAFNEVFEPAYKRSVAKRKQLNAQIAEAKESGDDEILAELEQQRDAERKFSSAASKFRLGLLRDKAAADDKPRDNAKRANEFVTSPPALRGL